MDWGTLAEEISILGRRLLSGELLEDEIIKKDDWIINIADNDVSRYVFVDGRAYDLSSEESLGKAFDEVVEAHSIGLITDQEFSNDWLGLKFLQLRLELGELGTAVEENEVGTIELYRELYKLRLDATKAICPELFEDNSPEIEGVKFMA